MSSVTFELRNSTKAEWADLNPVLSQGEPGVEYDTGQMKVGNGSDRWSNLNYVASGSLAAIVPPNSLITSTQWLTGGNSAGVASVFTSGDGQSWNASGSISSGGDYVYTLVWNGFQWLLGSSTDVGPSISTSPDGLTWTAAISDVFQNGVCYGIAYNGKHYVAVGKNFTGDITSTSTIATSYDGKHWTAALVDPFAGVLGGIGFGVCWDGSQWIAVGTNADPSLPGQSTSTLATSPDGVTWSNISNDPFIGGVAYSIAYNGSQYIVAGTNGGSLFYGGTAGTMTLAATNSGEAFFTQGKGLLSNLHFVTNDPFGSGNAYGVAWNGQKWLAVGTSIGNDVTSVVGEVATAALSADGFNWVPSSPFGLGIGYGVAWSGNYWVLSGTDVPPYSTGVAPTITSVSSQDGINWEVGANAVSVNADSVQYCVAVRNTLAGVSIPKTVAAGNIGEVQVSDGNGNFTSNSELYLTGGNGVDLVLNVPVLAPTNIRDSAGSVGTAGQVLASNGTSLEWQTGGGGGSPSGGVSGLDIIPNNVLVVSDGAGGVKAIDASGGGGPYAGFIADQGAGLILNVPAFSFQNTIVYDKNNAQGTVGQILTSNEYSNLVWQSPSAPSTDPSTSKSSLTNIYVVSFFIYDEASDWWLLRTSSNKIGNWYLKHPAPYWNGTIENVSGTPSMGNGMTGPAAETINYLTSLQNKGCKVLVSYGGGGLTTNALSRMIGGGTYSYQDAAESICYSLLSYGLTGNNPLNFAKAGTPWENFAFDGIDIDIEHDDPDEGGQYNFMKAVRTILPNTIITAAPQAPNISSPNSFGGNGNGSWYPVVGYLQSDHYGMLTLNEIQINTAVSTTAWMYPPLMQEVGLNYIFIQFYNQGNDWYPSRFTDPSSTDPTAFGNALATYGLLCLRSQVVLGRGCKLVLGFAGIEGTPIWNHSRDADKLNLAIEYANSKLKNVTVDYADLTPSMWLAGIGFWNSPAGDIIVKRIYSPENSIPNLPSITTMLYSSSAPEKRDPGWDTPIIDRRPLPVISR